MGTWIVLAIIILVVLWLVFTYNGLIAARNRTQEAWSEIDVELKRRHDLIPNLVNTVAGYMGHERGTLEAVTNARANAVAAGATGDPAKIGQAENMLSQSLRSLFAVSENYPELKAISAFTNLQENLTATEDKLEFSRRFYNGNVRDYNIKLQTLPTSLIAGVLGFKPFGFFQADEGDRAVPQVNFGNMPAPGSLPPPPAAGPGGPPAPGSAGPPPPSWPLRGLRHGADELGLRRRVTAGKIPVLVEDADDPIDFCGDAYLEHVVVIAVAVAAPVHAADSRLFVGDEQLDVIDLMPRVVDRVEPFRDA